MDRHADRWDVAFALVLSAITIVSRLPYRARMLYNWDAVQFALALREYDVVKHQPHPPGYVLYVALGSLMHAWVGDAAAAYVVLAVAFSGLTTLVVYFLARFAYDRATALTAAALLAVSPLFWFYGSVGLTYAGEALLASTVALFSFRALTGSRADAWLAAACLGLAGGMRQSILILLFPLWLGAVALGGRGRAAAAGPTGARHDPELRAVAIGLGVLAVVVLAWFVPMIWLTGGLGRYLAASLDLAESVVRPTSIVGGFPLDTTLRMSRYLLESVIVGLGPLALAALLVPWYVRRHGWTVREWFFVAWIVPPVLVYTLVHFGQAGYVLTFLPALVVFLSRVVVATLGEARLLASRPRLQAIATATAVAIVVLVNGSFFVNARPLVRDFETRRAGWLKTAEDEAFDWIFSRTAAALREHERVVETFVASIRGLTEPEGTVVITEVGNPRSYAWLRHAMFYLPAYTILELRVGDLPAGYYAPRHATAMLRLPGSVISVPAETRQLVWFVDYWSPTSPRPAGLVEIELPHGRFLYTLPVGAAPVEYAGYTLLREQP